MEKYFFKKGHKVLKEWIEKTIKTNTGRKHTEEEKLKIKQNRPKGIIPKYAWKKGRIPWNKGKKNCFSSQTIEKIKQSHRGKKLSENAKIKLSKFNKGEKCHFWKGGITPINILLRCSSKYKKWRSEVFERDSYTCQICRKVGGYLTAHHIKSWAQYPELRFQLNNGITLCEDCHKLTDNYKGRGIKKKLCVQ